VYAAARSADHRGKEGLRTDNQERGQSFTLLTVLSGTSNLGWAAHLPTDLAPDSVDILAGANLPAAFSHHWLERPSALALRDIDGTWLTSEELATRTAIAARRLRAAGFLPGDRVVVCAGTSAALVCAYVALLRAGLVAVPVNPTYTRGEVERVVRAARPAAAIVSDGERARWIRGAAPGCAVSGLDLGFEAVGQGGEVALDVARTDDPALLMYTSGTTGTPKGALLSHGNLLSSARAVALAWRWTPEDRLLLTLPLFHVHGLGVGIIGSLVSGSQVVLRPGFSPDDIAEQAGDDVTMFFAVPAMYQRLVASGHAEALAPLRLLVSGSAALSAAQSDAVAEAAGQRPLERYGMTETMMITSNPIAGPRKPGKVGLPLPGVELRLAEDGEVQVRGPNVMSGYDLAQPGEEDGFTADGWLRTGDLGELDEDGYLRLVGRSKELIISGGFNVHPREVEETLAAFPGVREVAVIGRPSDEWGEAVTAVVVAEEGAIDADELRGFAAERLAAYKVPKAVEFVDALPRNAMGKIVRADL